MGYFHKCDYVALSLGYLFLYSALFSANGGQVSDKANHSCEG